MHRQFRTWAKQRVGGAERLVPGYEPHQHEALAKGLNDIQQHELAHFYLSPQGWAGLGAKSAVRAKLSDWPLSTQESLDCHSHLT